jgi:hypothetical protein
MLDMDGTVTVPAINFRAMHREVLSGDATYAAAREAGGGSVDILHCVESWVPHLWCRACDIIARFEQGGGGGSTNSRSCPVSLPPVDYS